METKADKTVPYVIMSYGMSLIIPAIVSPTLGLGSVGGLLWCCFGTALFVLPGLWKIEYFQIQDSTLFKYNFVGLFKRTADLTALTHYKIKLINSDYGSNPLNVVRFFSKETKYLKYRKVTLEFADSSKMTLDERTIDKADFDKLLKKIKAYNGPVAVKQY